MKIDRDNIEVDIEAAWANRIDKYCPYGVLGIDWSAEGIGFGRLELIFDENGKAHIQSEHMDSNDDKRFTKAVLMKLIDEAIVED